MLNGNKVVEPISSKFVYSTDKQEKVSSLTEAQGHYILSVKNNKLVFCSGPAGTGKTYIAMSLALEALASKNTSQIILTRPAVEAGESFGFLPGDIDEKYAPYLAPFLSIINQKLGAGKLPNLIKMNKICPKPMAYMRGLTFDNAWVILDEAQNTTPSQMKMLLTRIGKNCKVIVCGDLSQSDISGTSGLEDVQSRLTGIKDIDFVFLGTEDIVRSDLVGEIIKAYDKGSTIN